MPYRDDPLVTDYIYHIFNKTIDHKIIFNDKNVCNNFLKVIIYYRSTYSKKHSYSEYLVLEPEMKEQVKNKISNPDSFQFEILSYCLMPTHFHFLLKQTKDSGLLKGFSNLLNSFVKHFNKINERSGPIFLPCFKSVIIKTENQFKHVSRYIHLNPYSSQIVQNFNQLLEYPFSSLKQYLSATNGICNISYLLNLFSNNPKKYEKFIRDNADYQKSLEEIKYLNKLKT